MTRHEGRARNKEYERLVKPYNGTQDTESGADHPNATVKRMTVTTAEDATTGMTARKRTTAANLIAQSNATSLTDREISMEGQLEVLRKQLEWLETSKINDRYSSTPSSPSLTSMPSKFLDHTAAKTPKNLVTNAPSKMAADAPLSLATHALPVLTVYVPFSLAAKALFSPAAYVPTDQAANALTNLAPAAYASNNIHIDHNATKKMLDAIPSFVVGKHSIKEWRNTWSGLIAIANLDACTATGHIFTKLPETVKSTLLQLLVKKDTIMSSLDNMWEYLVQRLHSCNQVSVLEKLMQLQQLPGENAVQLRL
jgi:hypothetical protein